MLLKVVYRAKSFERKGGLSFLGTAIGEAAEAGKSMVRSKWGSFPLAEGEAGIELTFRHVNEKPPDLLKDLQPTRVSLDETLSVRPNETPIVSGFYEHLQATAHVETYETRDGDQTKIHIESESVENAVSLFNKLRAKQIEPAIPWAV